jgi:molybdopterin molybdotransferase
MPVSADTFLAIALKHASPLSVETVPPVEAKGRALARAVQAGTGMYPAGHILLPDDLGPLASAGVSSVFVHRVPKVSVIVGGPCVESLMLAALARRDGGDPDIITDDDAVRETLLTADGDIILACGDARAALASDGEMLADGVAFRPAEAMAFGTLRGRLVFLLPRGVVPCMCAYDLFAGPVIRRLVGRPTELPYPRIEVPLAADIRPASGWPEYVRVRIGRGRAHPLPDTAAEADGFVLVPPDAGCLVEGDMVTAHLYPGQGG